MTTKDNHSPWSRRKFLATSAAGAGLVIAPSFLGGCGGAPTAMVPTTPTPKEVVANMGHFQKFGIEETIVKKVLSAALSKGGNFADLFFQHSISNYVGLEDGEVNRAYSTVKLGCGIRVLNGDQTGFAFTEDLTANALIDAAKTASAVANGPARPEIVSIQRGEIPNYYPIEVPFAQIGIDKKIPLLASVNEKARAFDKRIIKVTMYLGDSSSNILLANSDGIFVEDFQPMTTAYCFCVAEDGKRKEENSHSFGSRHGFELYSQEKLDELATVAAKRTITLFDAAQPPAGEYPVVLAPGSSGMLLHEAIGHGMEADFNRKGISVYADRIGKKIAPEFVTILDDGTNLNLRGSINVDDEGLDSKKTVLVENGILKSYMHDKISAKHYGLESTSNGRRESYKYPPVPRMRNTYMLNGSHTPEEIVKSVKKGVYAETFSNGQVRIGSGDFSFYLKNGFLIEDGKLTRPVKDANLIGFGPKVLEEVKMVGNDLKMYNGAGTCGKDGQRVPVGMGLPTVLCHGTSIGGTNNG